MSNDSSYSISPEDGVEICFSEVSFSEIDPYSLDASEGSSNAFAAPTDTRTALNPPQSFTFEAQVNYFHENSLFFDMSELFSFCLVSHDYLFCFRF